ncbi:MAG: ABC transporter permease subunit [Butyrivibrio sp.]|nr:ABC transporter permease subunit [Acetatifactor muris]MCM1560692.1 ABC transporter permease subunit [Butyrivibrio sp.]
MSEKTSKKYKSLKKKTMVGNIVTYIILTLISVVWLIPFVMIVLESFRGETTMQVGYVFPKEWSLKNYTALFTSSEIKYPRWYLNTLIIAVAVAVIQPIMVLCVSYTLSRTRFASRKLLMNAMLVIGMFPGFLSMIIMYKVLSGMGLTGTGAIWGLILVYTASSGMGYYVSKGFFDTVPKSLDEAARVDGATRARVLFSIIIPMSKPIIIYTILTAFMAPWGDFMFASYIAHNTSDGMNVAVGLNNMIGSATSLSAHYTQFCAGGVLVAIPITILFMCLQKYYVEGVTGGAVKG